jgi:Interferon-induced transmembrane protein/zinc-ribbon domain
MYCPQCGNANDDSAAFCGSCGMDLQKYKEQWAAPPADADAAAAAAGPDATSAADSGAALPGEPQAQPQAAPAAYPPPSAYPPPYQQQHQPTYQTPPYQAAPGYQPAGHYQTGAYQQPAYQPGYGYGIMPKISSYMGWAIATLILCFWPTGIVAVVYASQVGNRLALGDIPGAQEASSKAKTWTWVTFGIGVAWWIFWILIIIFVIAAGTYSTDYTF